jgi:hypothetical protein
MKIADLLVYVVISATFGMLLATQLAQMIKEVATPKQVFSFQLNSFAFVCLCFLTLHRLLKQIEKK